MLANIFAPLKVGLMGYAMAIADNIHNMRLYMMENAGIYTTIWQCIRPISQGWNKGYVL